jgi:aminoglycoside phosphotransferase family enzyme/predicted kinase
MSDGAPAAISETHISVLVFVGDRAYKLKKPVDLGFLDFRTRDARERACHREVELNRRLAPDVYLGVADIVGPDGELSDHLVVMRRMPEDRRLSTLITTGDPSVADHLREIARLLADFHSRAPRSPDIDTGGAIGAVRANWEDGFTQLRGPAGSVLDGARSRRVQELVQRYLSGRDQLFSQRIRDGHVCDGHGDLQAADIFCLDDGPRVLDCIEFYDRFRFGDVMADVAFLAMDLERLGAPDLAERFIAWYREFAAEECPASLLDHYVAYRAHVRTKVSCLRAAQLEGRGRDEAVAEANHLLELSLRHLERARLRLVLVGGLPGTGKSTLSLGLGARHGWTVLRSDELRKELAGLDVLTPAGAAFGEGLYAADHTDRVYDELLDRARIALSLGESVILDASWTAAHHRVAARQLGVEAGAEVKELRCTVPTRVAEQRLRTRREVGDASDADAGVARQLAAVAEPWPESSPIDTAEPIDAVVETACELLA